MFAMLEDEAGPDYSVEFLLAVGGLNVLKIIIQAMYGGRWVLGFSG